MLGCFDVIFMFRTSLGENVRRLENPLPTHFER
jgi:hypothetical protein